LISALHAQEFPVAAPVLACDDPEIVGTAFYVMDYVDGRVFWEPHMPGATAAERAAVYDAMNATIARLHAFEPAAIGALRFRARRELRRPPGRALVEAVPRLGDGEDRRDGALIAWLPAHIPPAGPIRLVHGDYRLDNMILAPAAPRILAVLDWELLHLGRSARRFFPIT